MACVQCAKNAGVYSSGYGDRTVVCSICKGKGYHIEETKAGTIEVDCRHCNGTGKCK